MIGFFLSDLGIKMEALEFPVCGHEINTRGPYENFRTKRRSEFDHVYPMTTRILWLRKLPSIYEGATITRDRMGLADIGRDPVPDFSIKV